MNSSLLAETPLAREHHPLGASTGYMTDLRGDWAGLVEEASGVSTFAVELAALNESELPALLSFLAVAPPLPFRYISVHAPTKARQAREPELVGRLEELPSLVDAIVIHPDQIEDPEAYRPLGGRLVIENMDVRKSRGRRGEELEHLFAELPEAGFCFDVAHAWTVDETMGVGEDLLDRFASRLRHVHLSSISNELEHVPLSGEDEALFARLLARCRDVPWILEAESR